MDRRDGCEAHAPRCYTERFREESASDQDSVLLDGGPNYRKRARTDYPIGDSLHLPLARQSVEATATGTNRLAAGSSAINEQRRLTGVQRTSGCEVPMPHEASLVIELEPPSCTADVSVDNFPALHATNLTQGTLQLACKRVGVSSSGAKATLLGRLR
jgi:hypothetical protein